MLSAATLLSAWERGGAEPPLRRALLLLEAAYPERPAAAWAELPVGRRDASLLDVREAAFGPRLECVVACPACGELLELACDVAELRAAPAAPDDAPLVVRHDGREGAFRLPTTRDLLAVLEEGAGAHARAHARAQDGARRLLARCLEPTAESPDADAGGLAVAELPEPVLAEIGARMEAADPQASVRLSLTCPVCAHASERPFDIVAYLWTEVDAWARRTLAEVHALAAAYGWSEGEILALSARRRQLYLELVRA